MSSAETIRQVGRLHAENLDQSFLSTLGEQFLFLMYRAIDECDGAVLVIESGERGVSGFVSGAESMSLIYRQMLRHWPQLIASLAPSLLNPVKIWRILEILYYSQLNIKRDGLPRFELLSIAVDREYRGRGVSDRLYERLIDHCRSLNEPAFKIIVGEALRPAHRFYERMGAEVVGEVCVHTGQRSLIYVQSTS